MEQITKNHVQAILKTVCDEKIDELFNKSDKDLLDTDLYKEFGMDSLDIQEMLCELSHQYHIDIDSKAIAVSGFFRKPTIRNFIAMCNKFQ